MLDLFIAIVNTNNREILHQCLESILLNTDGISYKVAVLDNFSEDGSKEMVVQEFPQVKLYINEKRKGLSKNWNHLLRENPDSRYSLILNEDIILKDNAFGRLAKFMDQHLQIGVSGCKLLYPDGRLQASVGAYPTMSDVLIRLGQSLPCLSWLKLFSKYSPKYWNYGKSQELIDCYPMGCCLMVRREAIEKVGLMDEKFDPIYLEETDWCYRIKKAGFKIYYLADVEVIHYHGYTIKKLSKDFKTSIIHAWFINRRYYFRKHDNVINYYFLVILDLVFFSISLLKWSILYQIKKEKREIARDQLEYAKKAWLEIFHRTKPTSGG